MGLLTTTLACLAMFPGCGGPPAVEAPPSVARFAISYERGGGLKPMPRQLTIRPGRIGEVMASRRGIGEGESAATLFKVPVKAIEGLRRALARARFTALPEPAPAPGTCADCYSYEISYRNHDVDFNEVTMPGSLGPVLDRLEAIVDAHLPFH